MFYGEILDWASDLPGCCEVEYAGGEVLLRSRGDIVARVESGSWRCRLTLRSSRTARYGRCGPVRRGCGEAWWQRRGGEREEAVLRAPDGAHFTVTSRRER